MISEVGLEKIKLFALFALSVKSVLISTGDNKDSSNLLVLICFALIT
jgi:hypothetical protein